MMPLTRTPTPAYSSAAALVSALSPAFAAEYTGAVEIGFTEASELMLIIEPPPVAFIASAARAVSRVGPLRLTPITLSNNVSDVASRDGASGLIPALLIRPSSRPQRPAAVVITRSRDSQSPTWQAAAK